MPSLDSPANALGRTRPAHPKTRSARRSRTQAAPESRLMRWLRAFLAQRLRLQRRGLHIHVLLDPAPAAAVPDVASGQHRGEALRRDHQALTTLLDRHADSRYTMRHLAYLEQALARWGSRAMSDIPPRVLSEARAQLDNLLQDPADPGFPELRARIAQAIDKRPRVVDELDESVPVDVSEASHSLFDEMEKSWVGEMPVSAASHASPVATKAH